jgi:hypothetical protein
LRAALISRRSAGFFSGSKQSSPEPSQFTQAFRIALRCFWLIFEPVTRRRPSAPPSPSSR